MRDVLRPLEELQASISSFVSSNCEARIASSRLEMERLRRDEQEKQRRKEEHEASLRSLEKDLVNEREYERSLNTEKKIRERKREISDLRKEVELLRKNLSSTRYESLTVEKSRLCREFHDLEKKLNSSQGRVDEVIKRVHELQKDLHMPQFKDAVRKYREKMLLIKCTETACEDLNKYYKALDTAIMRFHTEKMTAINRIIHQLWNSTYKGNDVDKIEIKTDETESKGADKRRTYNYRVVMHKRDAELDMRGRCSSGQKVLASLIIRMALAETFSKNCGILALDEPTTNLDRDNIRSLVDSLVGIVNQRSLQRNFQLIIITHDDEFLHGLTEVDQIKEYYHVQRDEGGFSYLSRVELEQARR
ncbi:P-loop containing nucleoside triphosphate hydrolase [Trinorchestia longiramus]|nr:P-loop containing nucleoside triphosphate hydrolase [Trinorchestia longiramus]